MAYLSVAIGGALGACLRYLITHLSQTYLPGFPFGTLISNVLAGIIIGVILELDLERGCFGENSRLFLTTGAMGGLSTFSTFSVETVHLFQSGKYLLSGLNVLLNLALSIAGVLIGTVLVKAICKKI